MKFSEIAAMLISDVEKDALYAIENELINTQMQRVNGIKQVIPLVFPEDKDGHDFEAIIDAWLIVNQAELDRRTDIHYRYMIMFQYDAGMPAFYAIYPERSNAILFFEEDIYDLSKEDAEEALSTIEDKFAELRLANQENDAINNRIAIGKIDREKCTKALDYISWYNTDKDFSIEQITQMQASFSDAEQALRAGRPSMAIAFISAIEPDGTIITADLKNKVLSLLA